MPEQVESLQVPMLATEPGRVAVAWSVPDPAVVGAARDALPDSGHESWVDQLPKSPDHLTMSVQTTALPVPSAQSAQALPQARVTVSGAQTSVIVAETKPSPHFILFGPEYIGPDSDIAPNVINRAEEQTILLPARFAAVPLPDNEPASVRTPLPVPHPDVPARVAPDFLAQTPQPMLASGAVPRRDSPVSQAEPRAPMLSEEAPAVQARLVEQRQQASLSVMSAPTRSVDRTAARHAATATREPALPVEPSLPSDVSVLRPQFLPPGAIPNVPSVMRTPSLPKDETSIRQPHAATARLAVPASTDVLDAVFPRVALASGPLSHAPLSPSFDQDGSTPYVTAKRAAAPNNCLVNRGPDGQMILVCDGAELSSREALRAVIEGESAFRELRSFDVDQQVIDAYGLNPVRYHAISRGPQSSADQAFLDALKQASRQTLLKGRIFDVYVVRGDKGFATVLVETL